MARERARTSNEGEPMGTVLKIGLGIVLGFTVLVVGCALVISDTADEVSRTLTEGAKVPTSDTKQADVSTRCAYVLGGVTDNYFVGSIDVQNTSDSAFRMRAVARWEQLGAPDLTQAKEFRVRAGESRTVQFRLPVSIEQISAHQSADGECRVQREIMG